MNKRMIVMALLAMSCFGQAAFAASEKTTICHKGVQTASVPASAVPGHQQHGDSLGACGAPTMAAVVMLRCEPQEGSVKVVAESSSPSPAISGGIVPGDDCAAVLAAVIDEGYGLRAVTTGSAEEDAKLHLYTDYLLLGTVPVATSS